MLLRMIAAAVIAAVGGSFVAEAQTMRDIGAPKELPPASFTANQYVDSRGCVFLRAGYGGQVNWVPRVTRDRKVLCGYEPSLKVATAAKAAPTPKPATGNVGRPTETVAVKTTPPRIKATAAPSSVPVASYAPAPVRPAAVRVAVAPVVRTTQARAATGQALCTDRSAVAQRLMVGDGRRPVRCGPQAGFVPSSDVSASGGQRQAMAQPAASAPAPVMPKGYKAAWTDGRLNVNRAKGTAAGKAAMDLIWTQETPRRLIDVTTGQEVTGEYPSLVYPYTDYALQQRTLGTRITVSTKGQGAQVAAAPAVKTRVSTKSQATARVAPVTATAVGKAYVQVGSYGVAANATGAAARLRASGLPVATGSFRKGGKTLQIVLAGPFTSQSDLGAALTLARRAGFSDAFIRH